LALINLVEDRRIHITPCNPPRQAFGLTEGGYETRVIEKKKFHFSIRVRPVRGRYDYGNPVFGRIASLPPPKGNMDVDRYVVSPIPPAPLVAGLRWPTAPPPPPPLPPGQLPGKPPLWFDINGNLVKSVWDLSVSAVVGIVAVRPHIDADGITGMVRPMMPTWDVKHILGWLKTAGLAEQVGKGWMVREYWWMVVV
jgi:transcription factor C subunit 3